MIDLTEHVIHSLKHMARVTESIGDSFKGTMPYITYLQEFRTVSMGLPRRAGKTTTLIELNSMYSSLLVNRNYTYKSANSVTLNSLPNVRGIKTNGLKYRAILLDEFETVPREIYEYIVRDLRPAGMLDDSLFILNLYTPRTV